jgi:uncharacterized protein (DUF488 family)
MINQIFTVGHSTHSIEKFIQLLKQHKITAIADVRSAPYSRHLSHFNRELLQNSLKENGIQYVFLGRELGARSEDECCYVDEKVSYSLLAKTKLFQTGIDRVIDGSQLFNIALMCAEKDPLDCHRTILVAKNLIDRGCQVVHVLASGSLESHSKSMERLLTQLDLSGDDLFRSLELTYEAAYEIQGEKIAYDRKKLRSVGGKIIDLNFNESEDL